MGRLSITAAMAVLALAVPLLCRLIVPWLEVGTAWASSRFQFLVPFSSHWASSSALPSNAAAAAPYVCRPHAYTTEIVSVDPLVMYLRDFVPEAEAAALVAAGEPAFAPSEVTKHDRKQHTSDRTSSSAALPIDDPAVACVLGRAEAFLGGLMDFGSDAEMGPPQLVRYTAGQRFNLHHDWYERPQPARRDKLRLGRAWNRAASFFAILEDNCSGGETHFPYLQPPATVAAAAPGGHHRRRDVNHGKNGTMAWYERTEEDGGGIAFKPVRGNAVFWVNLHANGTGDERTMHAGLPLGDGLKTAMNIWPRQYYL
ncbi:hypothetical protein PFICI_09295 [Pestalotiopsis fici W106-1]|uniref:Prolyl 4-hydroxylase alpha subunit domain-containing protein n=1 Tax=Pestalotiopsis fici (strain W106-1 / CGMCC3.15140) TaxID=1229662 RepID=W3X237_PESFW|nr:uncharacterized protein PFICI_09295 [Pestalotiopsis fici W106-1]ETS79442.1 hypothetical protein PFICI_09295 [Pestalotiopsis fici W106-1]